MKKVFTYILLPLLIIASSAFSYAQNASIHGIVTTSDGEPLIGANITLENTTTGTISDQNGEFQLNNLNSGTHVVEVSYVGFIKDRRTVSLSNGETVNLNYVLEESSTMLDEVYVKGQALKLENSVTTVDVIGNDRIQNLMATVTKPLQLIEHIPGMNITGGFSQGGTSDTYTIRGFQGGHSGKSGVEVDGISLTEAEAHSDGYADLNVLIPLNLSRVKVHKGPSSVLYGRFSQGGTIAMETRKGGEYRDVLLKGGSFNTFDAQYAQGSKIKLGESDKSLQTNFALQLFSTGGYTDNSDLLKGNFDGRIAYDISDNTDISLSVRGHRSKWQAPEYIGKDQYLDRELRREQAPGNFDNQGGNKIFTSERLDLNHKISDNTKLLVFGYALQQEFFRYRTKRLEANSRNAYAVGGSLNGNSQIAEKDLDWTAGIEYYSEATSRDHWHTVLRKKTPVTDDNGVTTDRRLDDDFDAKTFSMFAQGEYNLHRLFRPSIGVRFDAYGGGFKRFDLLSGALKSEDKIDNLSHISPKLGFRSTLVDELLDLRVSASNGFALPNRTQKYQHDNLEPVELWQYEVGLTLSQNHWLNFDVAGFIINSSKEVQEFPANSGEYINVGKTQRSGIEAKADVRVVDGLRVIATTSFTDSEIVTNKSNPELEGNKLMGIPETVSTVGIMYTSPFGLGADVNFRHAGSHFFTNDNKNKYNGHSITNLTLFYDLSNEFSSQGRVFFTVNNLFDELYANTALWTIYAPAPTRNFSLGVNYSF